MDFRLCSKVVQNINFMGPLVKLMRVVGYRFFIVILWGGGVPEKKFISTKDYESLPGLEPRRLE